MNAIFSLLLSAVFAIMIEPLAPGDKAPNFTAETTDGTHISLHDYLGKSNVVLYFYPADLSGGCTVEACKFRDTKSNFLAANTVILGVSLDDRSKHLEFTTKDSLNFPLLVDSDSTICREYGVPVAKGKYAARWTFLIDKNGKIAKIYQKVDPRTHSEELQKDIAELNAKQ